MRSTFKIAFFVNRSKEKKGIVPVLGRITINGSIAQFSCKQSVSLNLWDARSNRAIGKSDQALKLNRTLDNVRAQITKHYQQLLDKGSYVNAEKVRNAWQGIDHVGETLLAVFDKHNQEFEKRTGKDRALSTYNRYLIVRRHLGDFVKSQYHRSDIHLKEINVDFVKRFCMYLQINLGLALSSVRLYCEPLKMIVGKAHNDGLIPTNPFAHYRFSIQSKERGYLTENELKMLMNYQFGNPSLEKVRDLFIFGAFTGLSYIDIKQLTVDKIETFPNGDQWIMTHRKKTKIPVNVKLLDIPLKVIEKYTPFRRDTYIFHVPANCYCNLQLKEIAKICGIKKLLRFHMSRHSFATLALTKGVPLESVSKILGHTKIATTQIYAKITNEKIGRDMDLLSEKLEKIKH